MRDRERWCVHVCMIVCVGVCERECDTDSEIDSDKKEARPSGEEHNRSDYSLTCQLFEAVHMYM